MIARKLSVILVAATLPLLSHTQQTRPPVNGSSRPVKRALLVGINNYKYPDQIPPLLGSLNDVEDMRQLLIGKFEFQPENILVLTDSQATHAAIIRAVQTHLIEKTGPGDIVVFHYSGHGSQMKDVTEKMIGGLDETIVPYDSRDPEGRVFDISGAELHPLLLQLAAKTPNLTFILDSCHSGTLVRGPRVRGIPADTRTPPPLSGSARGIVQADAHELPRFATIAATTSKESAFELSAESGDHGALTYFLTQQLRNTNAGATYRDVMDNVIGNVTANYPTQHPQLEGAEADQYIFGDGSSLARSYVTASPSSHDPHRVTLNVGQVQGATVGSLYDVYPPASKKFAPPEKPVARVRLVSADAFTSEAEVVSSSNLNSGGTIIVGGDTAPVATLPSSGSIAAASRAVERQHRYGSLRMRVFFDGLDASPTLQSIRDALQPIKNVEVIGKPALCNMQLRQAGKSIQTLAADSTTLSPPVPIDDPNVVARVVAQVKSWAKWFNVLSIRNAQPEIDLGFTVKGSETRDPMARVGRPDMGVLEGEKIDAIVANNSPRELYITMLDLSSNGEISVIYPAEPGAKALLKPSETLSVKLTASIPQGRSVVTDVLKVFATYNPIDLTPLTQGKIRGTVPNESESNPVQQLLMNAAGETGDRNVSPTPLQLGDWTTVQRVVVVRRH